MSWMRSDASLKIISLVLAISVWAYVRSEAKPLQIFSVPLEIEGLPADLAVTGDVLDSVAVRVRAPDTTLRNLTPGRFRALVRRRSPSETRSSGPRWGSKWSGSIPAS